MLIRVEIEKLIRRKDVWVLMTMNFIPLMYAIGVANNSGNITYEGVGKASGFSFLGDMIVFVYMLFMYMLIVAMGQIRSFRGEMENGSIKLYMQRVAKRSDLFWAKVCAYAIITGGAFIVLGIVCVISYYVFLTKRTDIALMTFVVDGQFTSIVLGALAIILYFNFSGITAMLLSLTFKSYTSIAAFILIWVGFLYLKEFDSIRFAIPAYYLNRVIEDMGLGQDSIASFVYFSMVIGISSLMLLLARRRFERIDII